MLIYIFFFYIVSTFLSVLKKLITYLVFLSCRPAFAKLEEWLEKLKMHLDMRFLLVPELEQVHLDFWQKHPPDENKLPTHQEQPE